MAEQNKTNMNAVNKLLDIIKDWEDIVIERHIKFIKSYEKYNRDLAKAGNDFGFSKKDMLMIFLRIERTLKSEYNARVKLGFIDKVNLYYSDDRKVVPLKTAKSNSNKIEKAVKAVKTVKTFDINGVSDVKKTQIEEILKACVNIKNLTQVLLPSHSLIIQDLVNGMSFSKVLKKYGRSKDYTISMILGRKNPRYPSEKGILAFIQKADEDGKIEYAETIKVRKQHTKQKHTKMTLKLFELVNLIPDWKEVVTEKQKTYIEMLKENSFEESANKLSVKAGTIRSSLLAKDNPSSALCRLTQYLKKTR